MCTMLWWPTVYNICLSNRQRPLMPKLIELEWRENIISPSRSATSLVYNSLLWVVERLEQQWRISRLHPQQRRATRQGTYDHGENRSIYTPKITWLTLCFGFTINSNATNESSEQIDLWDKLQSNKPVVFVRLLHTHITTVDFEWSTLQEHESTDPRWTAEHHHKSLQSVRGAKSSRKSLI